MRIRTLLAVIVTLCCASSAFADGTIRYEATITFGPALADIARSGKSPLELKPPVLPPYVLEIKNGKLYDNNALGASILDSNTMQLTFIDTKGKKFATASISDFITQIMGATPVKPQAPVPPMVAMFLQSIQTIFSSKKTGRVDRIQGIEVEETEMTLAINMESPFGAMPATGSSPAAASGSPQAGAPPAFVRIVMHIWSPTPAEIQRVPALAANMSFVARMSGVQSSILGQVQNSLGKNVIPQSGGFNDMLQEFVKNPKVILRADFEIYAPILLKILPAIKSGSAPGEPAGMAAVIGDIPDADLKAPLFDAHLEATEVSSAPLDDSIFQVPSDYTETPLADLIHSMMPMPTAPKQIPPTSTQAPPASVSPDGTVHIQWPKR